MKKVISLLMSFVMLLSVTAGVDLSAYAADATSGKCGDSAYWNYDEDTKTLTISGSGTTNSIPWNDYKEDIQKVLILNGVTSITSYAFSECTALTSIEISNSVKNIGNSAFFHCNSLVNVIIPNNVINIGEEAFSRCSNIKNLKISNSVTNIGTKAFYDCSSLLSVVIPSGVTSIGRGSFGFCSNLSNISVEENNKYYSSIDGVLFNKNYTSLIQYPVGKIKKLYTIPSSVTYIEEEAFCGCNNLHSVIIPNSMLSVGDFAFNYCTSLTSVTISNGVTSIGDYAFYCCKNLIDIMIPNSVTSIGDWAFKDCYKLTDVYYTGTREQWKNISIIGGENYYLTDATIHYDFIKSIVIFTTEKSLNIEAGKSMSLAFGLMDNNTGSIDKEWKKMAVTVSDSTVISLSDYKKSSEYGFYIDVFGKKQGSTNVIITDTETGANTSFVVNVYKPFDKTYSYAVDNMSVFYPNNKFENHIATNIYNLNGIYVNNYQYTENNGTYYVEFDAYNSRYYAGAVDIYDENGMWLGYEEIEKYSNISSIRDVLDQTFYLISNTTAIIPGGKRSNLLTYEQESFAKHTHVKINVPKNGYFTISNNISSSPGTYFVNAFEILFDATTKFLDLAMSNDVKVSALHNFKKNASKTFASHLIEARNEALKDEIKKNAQLIKLSAMQSEIEKITKNFSKNELKDKISATNEMYSSMATYAENIIQSFGFGDNWWKKIYSSATGIAESVFTKFAGPAGVALKGCFEINKLSDKLLMGIQMSASTDKPYITVYSKVKEDYNNPYGITVDSNGNVNKEAVLQVFRISNTDVVETLLDNDNPLEKHELYNICFVKDDKLVQPNGKVTVYVPIPTGMNSNTCKIYRQETDGSWTILDAHIKGNYLVFETDHFSLYSVIGDMIPLTISSMPNKVNYSEGETLNTNGLVLDLNGEKISEGFICDPVVLSGAGEHNITVSYGNTFAQFNVNVVNSCEHSFKDYKYNNDATCTTDGTKTATCEYGCGTTDTVTAPNTAKGHKFVENEKYCINGCKTLNPNYKDPTPTPGGGSTGGGSTDPAPVPGGGGGGGAIPAPEPTPDDIDKKDDDKKPETKPSEPTKPSATKKPAAVKVNKLIAKKKAIVVYWNKVNGVDGYHIQFATDKKFKKNRKSVIVAKQNASKKTVKKLKAKKKYYVRVRAYKLANGKKIYGKWSKIKSVKIK